MKKILSIAICILGALVLVPSADAGYRRTIVGYDSRGNPIIRVTWVADQTDPAAYGFRRTYPTNGNRDTATIFYPPTVYQPYFKPAYGRAYLAPPPAPGRVNVPTHSAASPDELK